MPSIPSMPAARSSVVLPQWMYGDPAEVAQRVEQSALNRELRVELTRAEIDDELRAQCADLYSRDADCLAKLSEVTRRLVKRARIRELVAAAMGKKAVA